MKKNTQELTGTAGVKSELPSGAQSRGFDPHPFRHLKEAQCHPHVTKVEIRDGYIVLVDTADLPLLAGQNWYPLHSQHLTYANSTNRGGLMHRVIMGLSKGDKRHVDHIDGNGLNNTRENLRIGSQGQNRANSRKLKPAASKYKGVCAGQGGKWRAQICAGKQRYLGTFATEEEAARRYDEEALKRFGEFAKVNFPQPSPQAA